MVHDINSTTTEKLLNVPKIPSRRMEGTLISPSLLCNSTKTYSGHYLANTKHGLWL